MGFVQLSPFLVGLASSAPQPNAYTVLEAMPQDQGCTLSYAADLVLFLTEQIRHRCQASIHMFTGLVRSLDRSTPLPAVWEATLQLSSSSSSCVSPSLLVRCQSSRVVLATGSAPLHPASRGAGSLGGELPELDLDIALSPTLLRRYVAEKRVVQVAVVGSSHSAILALKNVTDLSADMSVTHYSRSALRFAEYKDGWILYDNTGLKGLAADWAASTYPTLPQIQAVHLSGDPEEERETYTKTLRPGTHTVYAIGFERSPLPLVRVDGKQVTLAFDGLTGCFQVPSLYGCGIAFPQRVTDRAGNRELAVGFFKFMVFVQSVCSHWI